MFVREQVVQRVDGEQAPVPRKAGSATWGDPTAHPLAGGGAHSDSPGGASDEQLVPEFGPHPDKYVLRQGEAVRHWMTITVHKFMSKDQGRTGHKGRPYLGILFELRPQGALGEGMMLRPTAHDAFTAELDVAIWCSRTGNFRSDSPKAEDKRSFVRAFWPLQALPKSFDARATDHAGAARQLEWGMRKGREQS